MTDKEKIKELADACNYALNKLYTLINTKNGMRYDLINDAVKADLKIQRALDITGNKITFKV